MSQKSINLPVVLTFILICTIVWSKYDCAKELLLKTSTIKRGKWLIAIIILSVLGVSALYEIFECLIAIITGESASAFLATQGDVWDTQKDMALAGIGASIALITLADIHDKQLK